MSNSSVWTFDKTLSCAITPNQSGPGRERNKGILHIFQSSSISCTSPSDCLLLYLGHSLGGDLTSIQRCCQCILQPWPTGRSKDLVKHSIELSIDKYTSSDIYIYKVSHRQSVSQDLSVARYVMFPKLGSKPSWLIHQL